MLQFAKGVPLGEKGLDWLKIHLVTLHGAKKKSSLQERLNYADEIMDDVLDSADNPLTVRWQVIVFLFDAEEIFIRFWTGWLIENACATCSNH